MLGRGISKRRVLRIGPVNGDLPRISTTLRRPTRRDDLESRQRWRAAEEPSQQHGQLCGSAMLTSTGRTGYWTHQSARAGQRRFASLPRLQRPES